MFRSHRAIYNKLVESSKEDAYRLNIKDLSDKYRPISQKHSLTNYLPEYHLDIPEEVMNSTYRDFTKAIKSSRALYKVLKDKGDQTTFPQLKFKSRWDNSSSIEIRSKLINLEDGKMRFFPTYFGFNKQEGFKIKEDCPEIMYSVRLLKTREHKYYMCIPQVKKFTQTNSLRSCAIDPGVRDFITVYDPAGLTIGVRDGNESVFKRCLEIDRLQSRLSKNPTKRDRHRLRKKIYRVYQRIKAMISDMHHKVSKWLSNRYDEVLLPSFNTSEMTSRQKRISSKTSRSMLTWAHYRFKQLLNYKMERTGGRVIDCTEYYTSKTCTQCGRINRNLTSQKTYHCPKCNLSQDRDVNAARNIYLKNEHLLSCTHWVQVSEIPTPRLSVLAC